MTDWAIRTRGLTKQFPIQGKGLMPARDLGPPAVDGVDLDIQQGELFGLLGPNGAGKTTLIKMLCTLVLPTMGEAQVGGFPLSDELNIKRMVGLVTTDERSFYWRLTGRQNLAFFASLYGIRSPEKIDEVLKTVGLQPHADKDFKAYSTGMRQRLSIARALLHQPRILFLDEPTKGLDPPAVIELQRLVRDELVDRLGMTVILTTHRLDEAEKLCDRVAIMHEGRIRAFGSIPDLREILGLTAQYHLRTGSLTPVQQAALPPALFETRQKKSDELSEGVAVTIPADKERLNETIDSLRAAGVPINEIQLEQVPLEIIFEKLTVTDPKSQAVASKNMSLLSARTASPSKQSLSVRTQAFLRIAVAFLRRDIQNEVSYRFSFLLQFAGVFFNVGVFYFVALLIGDAATPYLSDYGGDFFSFVLIGLAFVRYFGVGMTSFSNSIRRSQTTGTLEAMLTTPVRLSTIVMSSSLWSYLFTTLQVFAYLFVGTVFLGVSMRGANILGAILTLLLTIIAFSSLGILAASFIMWLKRGDPVTWLFNALSALLGGVYYPIEVLPPQLQIFTQLLPITYALRAMRLALLQGANFTVLAPDLFALFIFSIILLPLSLLAFQFAVRQARIDGSLTHY